MRTPCSPQTVSRIQEEIKDFTKGFDFLKEHVIVTDSNANIIYANAGVTQATGFSCDEVMGKNPADVWGGHMPDIFYENMWREIKERKTAFVGEVKNIRKDGVHVWQELHISPILDEKGAVKFFVGIEPDVSPRKQKESFQKEFLSVLGHQLQNPVTGVKWSIERLLERGELAPEQLSIVKNIYETSKNMGQLVADLLVISHIQTNGNHLEHIGLIAEVLNSIDRIKSRFPRVAIEFHGPQRPAIVKANKILLVQCFENLIHNAAKYADPQNGRVEVMLTEQPNHWVFSVENNGTPIPAEEHPRVFLKFFRGSNATQGRDEGSGLGLYIVKMICERYGWGVSFESPNAEGATVFSVRIKKDGGASANDEQKV